MNDADRLTPDENSDAAASETNRRREEQDSPPSVSVSKEWAGQLSKTDLAPSFEQPASSPSGARPSPVITLQPGDCIDDFRIESVLGRGAFGVVYLAIQQSLHRRVALKISPNHGAEGRTMAQLDHENIVRVFSESVSQDGTQRLLCMQYIHGATLEAVIKEMHGEQPQQLGGGSILQLIDQLHPDPPPFHPAAMRERQELQQADSVEAVCWIGERLADALAYAHQKGVLHRDIKPANILQTRYGRPMLADFNLAFQPIDVSGSTESLFGGTLAYMSPEHMDAFHPHRPVTASVVDERSDLFSLGVVLFELAHGHVDLPPSQSDWDNLEKLEFITEHRKEHAPAVRADASTSEQVFDRTIRKCLQPDPTDRYADASELASCLAGCRALSEVEKDLPKAGLLTRSALKRPFLWLAILATLPHLPIGSSVNISYNAFQIVSRLTAEQKEAFQQLILIYNSIVYPVCCGLLIYLMRPVYIVWKKLRQGGEISAEEIASARQRAVRWPMWVVILACVGWMPGGIFFPWALPGQVAPWVFAHFLISCTLSGLISMTYSYFAIQYISTRVFYPNLWTEVRNLRATALTELGDLTPYLRYFQKLAGLVPLSGAILVVLLGPRNESVAGAYEFLVITLIVLGFCGFELATNCSRLINQTFDALTKQRHAAK